MVDAALRPRAHGQRRPPKECCSQEVGTYLGDNGIGVHVGGGERDDGGNGNHGEENLERGHLRRGGGSVFGHSNRMGNRNSPAGVAGQGAAHLV